jgi:hypothetical protein
VQVVATPTTFRIKGGLRVSLITLCATHAFILVASHEYSPKTLINVTKAK